MRERERTIDRQEKTAKVLQGLRDRIKCGREKVKKLVLVRFSPALVPVVLWFSPQKSLSSVNKSRHIVDRESFMCIRRFAMLKNSSIIS